MSNLIGQLSLWLLYFVTDIYGHVAFKFLSTQQQDKFDLWATVFSFWGITAILSWAASSLMWITLLANNQLFTASSIATLTYALMLLSAVVFFKETISPLQMVGMLFLALGVYFVTRS